MRSVQAAAVVVAGVIALAGCTAASAPIRPTTPTPTHASAPTPASPPPSTPRPTGASPTTALSAAPASDYAVTHVPARWVVPQGGWLLDISDPASGASYDLIGYSAADCLDFYRVRLTAPDFTRVADATAGDVTTLIYDDAVYRTTITSIPAGVHVEHRTR